MTLLWLVWAVVMLVLLRACDRDAQEADRSLDDAVRKYGD